MRVGPNRSELIRPRLAVRVDPVRVLYLPLYDTSISISLCSWQDKQVIAVVFGVGAPIKLGVLSKPN